MSNTQRRNIKPGVAVKVIQKQHQSNGELTSGIVEKVLTNSSNHHRGIKVRLASGIVGRVADIVSADNEMVIESRPSMTEIGPRPTDFKIADFIDLPIEKDWACTACTFLNSQFLKECEMCGCKY
jgi:uncharacterized repeat protein (TIGR03833 family)